MLNDANHSIEITLILDGMYHAGFANQLMVLGSQFAAWKDFGIQINLFQFQIEALKQVLDVDKFLDLKTEDGQPAYNIINEGKKAFQKKASKSIIIFI